MSTSSDTFLKNLQKQAEVQSQISSSRMLPKQLDFLTTLLGNYPWQILLLISGFSALMIGVKSL